MGSSTVVPVRAIAEGMHSVVGWDEATKTVTVEKEIKTSRLHKFQTHGQIITVLTNLMQALNNAESVKYQVADLNASSLMRVASARHKATDTLPTVIWQKSNTLTIQMY